MPDKAHYQEADRTLVRSAWGSLKSGKAPAWITVGILVVFTARVHFCSYEDPIPSGLDFEWYGNHCGPGHGDPNDPALDELDEACKRHDAAYGAAEVSSS